MTGKGKTEILPLRGRDPAEKYAVRMTNKGTSAVAALRVTEDNTKKSRNGTSKTALPP